MNQELNLQEYVYEKPVKGWAKIPHCLYDVSTPKKIYVIGVYVFLRRRLNNQTLQCNPSQKDIAKHLSISKKQVGRALQILEGRKIIQVHRRRGYGSHYRFRKTAEWDWVQERFRKKLKTGRPEGQDSRSPP